LSVKHYWLCKGAPAIEIRPEIKQKTVIYLRFRTREKNANAKTLKQP